MKALSILALPVLALTACAAAGPDMPNPASRFCQDLGGQSQIRATGQGQQGFCLMPDGRLIDEWDLWRSRNPR